MKRSIGHVCALIAGALSFTITGSAGAVGVNEMSFQQQVDKADAVIIATPTGAGEHYGSGGVSLTRMTVLRVLKGDNHTKSIDFVTRGSITELDPRCCKRGRTYLLLLLRGNRNVFEVVNGHYSVIPVN
jgi:hypothetical protein